MAYDPQQGSTAGDKEKQLNQGGYMRSLHTVEEKLYAPTLKLSGDEFKTLLYVRHNSLRWDQEMNSMSYKTIADGTGIEIRNVKRIIKSLLKQKLITVERCSVNGVYKKNKIGLNAEYFGTLIEETCRPKMSIINGGKSNPAQGVVSDTPLGVVSHTPLGWGSTDHHKTPQEVHPEREPGCLKNPLKEQEKNLLKGIPEIFNLSGEGAETPEQARERLIRQSVELEARGWK